MLERDGIGAHVLSATHGSQVDVDGVRLARLEAPLRLYLQVVGLGEVVVAHIQLHIVAWQAAGEGKCDGVGQAVEGNLLLHSDVRGAVARVGERDVAVVVEHEVFRSGPGDSPAVPRLVDVLPVAYLDLHTCGVAILAHAAEDVGLAVLLGENHAVGNVEHVIVVDGPVEFRRVVHEVVQAHGGVHFDGISAVVKQDGGFQFDAGHGSHGVDTNCVAHAVIVDHQAPLQCVAASVEDGARGGTDVVGGTQCKAVGDVVVDEFAPLVVTQQHRLVTRIDGDVDAEVVELDVSHLVIFHAHCLEHPSAAHATRRALGGGVDDLAVDQHLGRASGIVVHQIAYVGAYLSHNHAHHARIAAA